MVVSAAKCGAASKSKTGSPESTFEVLEVLGWAQKEATAGTVPECGCSFSI